MPGLLLSKTRAVQNIAQIEMVKSNKIAQYMNLNALKQVPVVAIHITTAIRQRSTRQIQSVLQLYISPWKTMNE